MSRTPLAVSALEEFGISYDALAIAMLLDKRPLQLCQDLP